MSGGTVYTITVLRRDDAQSSPYEQVFEYEPSDKNESVANALYNINLRPGVKNIEWTSSCLQKKCGACAMIINGRPGLACSQKLSFYKDKKIRLEPLRKFNVVRDLLVDRSAMFENLLRLQAFLKKEAENSNWKFNYEACRCMQCGLCLEVCPNFSPQESFTGPASFSEMARIVFQDSDNQRASLVDKKNYSKHIFEGCGKSLACKDICPAKIPLDGLMARTNAAAVWGKKIRVEKDGRP